MSGCTLCIAHWSIYLTSYCSMSVRCLLQVRLKRTLAENKKGPPLLAKTGVRIELSNCQPWGWLGYLVCVLSATNWPWVFASSLCKAAFLWFCNARRAYCFTKLNVCGWLTVILQWPAKLRLNTQSNAVKTQHCTIQMTISIVCIIEVGTNI